MVVLDISLVLLWLASELWVEDFSVVLVAVGEAEIEKALVLYLIDDRVDETIENIVNCTLRLVNLDG